MPSPLLEMVDQSRDVGRRLSYSRRSSMFNPKKILTPALMLLCRVLSWGFSGLIIFEVQQNFYGQHIGKVDAQHLTSFVKGLYALSIIYPMALTFSKLSLIALYWRIFRDAKGRTSFVVVAAVNLAWMIAAVSGPHSHGGSAQ